MIKKAGFTAVAAACLGVLTAPPAHATWVVGCFDTNSGWVCAPLPTVHHAGSSPECRTTVTSAVCSA